MIRPFPLITSIVNLFYSEVIFSIPNSSNAVFLTFDDGPTPDVTPWALDVLDIHNIKAVFFCIGQQVEKYPHLFQEIIDRGHLVGNHTYHHLSGWKTEDDLYIEDIAKASTCISSSLFRPPYGRIKRKQFRAIKDTYKIVLWDVMSHDYDTTLSADQCVKNVVNKIKSGSIIVMHDSVKAGKNMKESLPFIIHKISEMGYVFGQPSHFL